MTCFHDQRWVPLNWFKNAPIRTNKHKTHVLLTSHTSVMQFLHLVPNAANDLPDLACVAGAWGIWYRARGVRERKRRAQLAQAEGDTTRPIKLKRLLYRLVRLNHRHPWSAYGSIKYMLIELYGSRFRHSGRHNSSLATEKPGTGQKQKQKKAVYESINTYFNLTEVKRRSY